jgi:hypothetical protein
MNDPRVNAEPMSVRALAAALARYQREVADAGRHARSALANAHWHDRQKDRFEQRYLELQKTIDHFLAREIPEMIRSLDIFAVQLEEILNRRM